MVKVLRSNMSECNMLAINQVCISLNNLLCLQINLFIYRYLKGDGILINDIYHPHLNYAVAEKLHEHKIRQFTIPGGCTSKLQPLNNILQKLKVNKISVSY